MRRPLLAGLGLLALMTPEMSWSGETMTGRAVVLDGDTLSLRGKVIGLHGIAAPGLEQVCLGANGQNYACGAVSARALTDAIGDATVSCEPHQADQDGRLIATCRRGAEDLSAWMAAQGYATAHRSASAPYLAEEKLAWARRRGLWAGVFDDPAGRRRPPYAAARRIAAAEADQRAPIPSTVVPSQR